VDHEICGFEHLHRHTHFSLLDGYAHPEEYASYSSQVNQQYLCISDHGQMGAIPRQIATCEKHGIHPIFACELYINPLQPACRNKDEYEAFLSDLDEEQKRILRKSFHLLAIAHSEEGYKNLVNLSSWAWVYGMGGRPKRPRINHEQLVRYKEGITFSSACYNSEIAQAFGGFSGEGGNDAGFEMVKKYHDMLGDNFFLEIMLLDFKEQKPYDKFIIDAHDEFGIPIVLTNDCHYCYKDDSKMQRYSLMIQTGKTINEITEILSQNPDADMFELQDTNLWMKSEDELNEMWEAKYSDVVPYEIFKEGKRNSVRICERAQGVELDRDMKLPQFPDDKEAFKEAIFRGFKERNLPGTKAYLGRIKEEYELICRKGFASYFLIQKEMVDEARRICPEILGWGNGCEAVGPGRGSAVGALVCYCLGITDVDPLKHDLLFSRFLSESRGGKQMKLKFTIDPILEGVESA
jgi:DNA polymerase-3 subunit alpha